MQTPGWRKCDHCKDLFIPDPRQRTRQRCCGKPDCRRARKAESQRCWLAKPGHENWWRGPTNIQRVRDPRAAHPGYWRREKRNGGSALQDASTGQGAQPESVGIALQDAWQSQPPLVLGLIAHLTGVALQDDMAGVTRRLIARGQALLGETNPENDREKNPVCRATASCAGSV